MTGLFGAAMLTAVKGYLVTVAVEVPVLVAFLSGRHSFLRRLCLGFWLTACSYPLASLTLPSLLPLHTSRALYVALFELIAITVELPLFFAVFPWEVEGAAPVRGAGALRDGLVVVGANACSFAVGEVLRAYGFW